MGDNWAKSKTKNREDNLLNVEDTFLHWGIIISIPKFVRNLKWMLLMNLQWFSIFLAYCVRVQDLLDRNLILPKGSSENKIEASIFLSWKRSFRYTCKLSRRRWTFLAANPLVADICIFFQIIDFYLRGSCL